MKTNSSTLYTALLLVFSLSCAEAYAQIGVGFRAGILTNKEAFDDDNSNTTVINDETVTGYTFGIPVEVALSKVFSIQPEVNFQRRGTNKVNQFNIGPNSIQQSIERNINYLEIPLLFKLGYTTESFTVAAVAGPTFSYAVSGTTTAGDRVSAGDGIVIEQTAGDYDIDFDQEGLKRADFGAHLGAQFGIPAGPGKILLDARYQLGFTNLNDGNDDNNTNFEDYETRSRGYSATLGYMLTFGNY